MELQTAFYIIGIIFMSLMTLIIIAILIAVLVIKSKIDHLHAMVNEKVDQAKSVVGKVSMGLDMLRRLVKH
jgi:hypothetical protein